MLIVYKLYVLGMLPFSLLRLRLHKQIKYALYVQTLTEFHQTDFKIEQIKVVLYAHVSKA